jgi:hypothetical protein
MIQLISDKRQSLKEFTENNYAQGSFFWNYLLKNKEIKVNGKRVDRDIILEAGDAVAYFLTKKQEELLKPFHEKVATAIQNFATAGGYQMIVDIAITALPYYSPEIDITEEIIKLVK